MRILITGASGLLGFELVRSLAAEGHAIRAFDRLPPRADAAIAETFTADLRDAPAIERACAGVEAIIHCAAVQHHSNPPRRGRERFFMQNIEATASLLGAAKAGGIERICHISSDMVYGMPPGRPLRESDSTRPIGPYGRSKLGCERLVEASGLRASILRPRLIVGPGRLGILRPLFDRIRAGKLIPVFGDGRNRYQMVAVADVAAAARAAIAGGAVGTFNIGSAAPPVVNDLLGGVIERAGSGSRLLHIPAAPSQAALWTLHAAGIAPLVPEQFRIAPCDYTLDHSRARAELGWEPRLSDGEMLWQAYAAYIGRE